MDTSFPAIGGSHAGIGGENSFWPSFTDIMIVVTMIFLMATSLLVVRNWQLVAELQESMAAERMASQMVESTTQENATLEERLANAEQSNSILRLRLMKKDEELARAEAAIREQEADVATLEIQAGDLRSSLEQTRTRLEKAAGELQASSARNQQLSEQLATVNQQLAEQQRESEQVRGQLETANRKISELQTTSAGQQENISELTREKRLLNQQIEEYNQQLLTLKGDYETVKSKYEELIKPARSAKGKYIAEVYYVKGESGNVIRYREPGDDGYTRLSLAEVESRLAKLKQERGEDLYVKIIIPEDSGLSYNEAWNFMRNLLVKYDYYYQK
ncbi:MAG: hypothetical protein PVI79_18765 [Gammaproteobacteria bacterium]